MKNVVVLSILLTGASFSAVPVYGQAPSLGAVTDFALFTGNGAFTNTLASVVTGDIGTNNGALTGFPPGMLVSGQIYVEDDVSAAASIAVTDAYNSLTGNTCGTQIDAALASQTLGPGIYCSTGAVSLDGNLTLDGGGDSEAIFIFRIGGAFSMENAASLILINGAGYENVYWQVVGAFNMGEDAAFRGTMIAHDAIGLLNGASITGRGLSVAGAISTNNNIVTLPSAALPVTLVSFTASKGEGQTVLLSWTTAAETRSDRFEIEHSTDGKSWSGLGTVTARGESTRLAAYSFTDEIRRQGLNLYHLKMIDKDASFSYSPVRSIVLGKETLLSSFPNPVTDQLTLTVADMTLVEQIQLNDMKGREVYSHSNASSVQFPGYIDVAFLPAGVYILRVIGNGGNVSTFKVLKQ